MILKQKTVAEHLGEIVWLMSQDDQHSSRTIKSLENDVMPLILAGQFRTFYADKLGKAATAEGLEASENAQRPVGVVFWIMLEKQIHKEITESPNSIRLKNLKDLPTGDFAYINMVVAPFGAADAMKMECEALFRSVKSTNDGIH